MSFGAAPPEFAEQSGAPGTCFLIPPIIGEGGVWCRVVLVLVLVGMGVRSLNLPIQILRTHKRPEEHNNSELRYYYVLPPPPPLPHYCP